MALTDEDKVFITQEVDNRLRFWGKWGTAIATALGIVNVSVLIISLWFVFFVLPSRAAQEAKSQINSEIAELLTDVIEQSTEAIRSAGEAQGNVKQIEDDIEEFQNEFVLIQDNIKVLDATYTKAVEELDAINTDIKLLRATDPERAAEILATLNDHPDAEQIITKLSEIEVQLSEINSNLEDISGEINRLKFIIIDEGGNIHFTTNQAELVFGTDGNLQIYTGESSPEWQSKPQTQ